MAMVDVDGSCQFSMKSQPKLTGLVWGLAATWRSVYIHEMNSHNDFGYDDSTINTVMVIIIIIIIIIIRVSSTSRPISTTTWKWYYVST